MISKDEYQKIFRKSFYNKIITDSLALNKKNYTRQQFNNDVDSSYKQLCNYTYCPDPPLERIFFHKNNYVARIITLFHPKDEIVYYFLTKMIEDSIAENRIEGTYGGWRIDNKIRITEKEELDEAEYFINSYNSPDATKNWKEFSRYIKYHFDTFDYAYAIMFDISNFYDSINLNILERKLNERVTDNRKAYISPLMYFLKYWNRKREKYNMTTVGIPQTEFGDQSRLLANFYLQEYDVAMAKICNGYAKYLRFADDQIILFNDEKIINRIMYKANDELNKIGLNINSKKTLVMTKSEIENYYLYDPLTALGNKKYDEAFEKFHCLYKNNTNIRLDTFLRRCLNVGIDKFSAKNQKIIKRIVTTKDFIINNSFYYMKKVYTQLNEKEKKLYLKKLRELRKITFFNEFHYMCLKLYEYYNINEKEKLKIIQEIEELNN